MEIFCICWILFNVINLKLNFLHCYNSEFLTVFISTWCAIGSFENSILKILIWQWKFCAENATKLKSHLDIVFLGEIQLRNQSDGSAWCKSSHVVLHLTADMYVVCRQIVETIVKIKLPDDLHDALRDGVILCHLANHLRPHSISSVHVPSPSAVMTFNHCVVIFSSESSARDFVSQLSATEKTILVLRKNYVIQRHFNHWL